MKKIVFFLLIILIPSITSHAQTSAPQLINFQGVLVDEGGNVLYDIQEADVRFSIVGGGGAVLYEEIQHVPIISGAISVLVGNGSNPNTGAITSGIPYDVFTAEGSKILRVRLEEHPIPQEDVQIVSVPYAYQAQYAVDIIDPIESSEILDRTIQQIDLSEELLSYIESSITGVSEADLLAHRTESGAHPATSISVENSFVNTPGTNLQQVLQGIDTAIGVRTNQDGVLGTRIDDETAAREAHTNATSAHGSDGAIVGTNTLSSSIAAHSNTAINTAHPTGNLPTSRLSGQITNSQIANDAITSSKVADNAIGSSEIATGAVGSDEIADGTITSSDIANGTIISEDISDGTIISADIADGTISSGDIAEGTITSSDIAEGTITTAELDLGDTFVGWDTNASNDITTSGGTISGGDLTVDGNIVLGGIPRSEWSGLDPDSFEVVPVTLAMTPPLNSGGGHLPSGCTMGSTNLIAFCEVSANCVRPGDDHQIAARRVLLGCTGYYSAFCWHGRGCGFMGTRTSGTRCYARAAQGPNDVVYGTPDSDLFNGASEPTLTAQAICGLKIVD